MFLFYSCLLKNCLFLRLFLLSRLAAEIQDIEEKKRTWKKRLLITSLQSQVLWYVVNLLFVSSFLPLPDCQQKLREETYRNMNRYLISHFSPIILSHFFPFSFSHFYFPFLFSPVSSHVFTKAVICHILSVDQRTCIGEEAKTVEWGPKLTLFLNVIFFSLLANIKVHQQIISSIFFPK